MYSVVSSGMVKVFYLFYAIFCLYVFILYLPYSYCWYMYLYYIYHIVNTCSRMYLHTARFLTLGESKIGRVARESLPMRKSTICIICENKDADQLISAYVFATHPCTINLLPIYIQSFKLLALCCDCTAWFVSVLFGNPNCWFSHAQARKI